MTSSSPPAPATPCEATLAAAIQGDERIRAMLSQIRASAVGKDMILRCLEGHVNEDDSDRRVVRARAFFSADKLDNPNAGPPEIVVVTDRVQDGDLKEVLRHELVHAYDHCVRRKDLTDVEELSCSEIRAHMVAECARDKLLACREVVGSSFCSWARGRCARTRAVRAVSNVFPQGDEARKAVEKMMQICVEDEVKDFEDAKM